MKFQFPELNRMGGGGRERGKKEWGEEGGRGGREKEICEKGGE